MHDLAQLYIFITSALAIWCVARTDKFHRWGYVWGLLSEPGWFYAAWATDQWGVMLLVLWWSWYWAAGMWRRFA